VVAGSAIPILSMLVKSINSNNKQVGIDRGVVDTIRPPTQTPPIPRGEILVEEGITGQQPPLIRTPLTLQVGRYETASLIFLFSIATSCFR